MKALSDNPALLFLFGGVLTLVSSIIGGYVGSRLLIRNQRRGDKRELVGAIQVARSELVGNAATIAGSGNPWAIVLSDRSFRSVETILAQNLPMPLFVWINVVNSQMMRAQDGIALLRDRPNAAMSDKDIADLKRVADRALVGSKLLLRYVRETLKVTATFTDTETTTPPDEIEKQIEDLLFRKRSFMERIKGWIDRHTYKETAA
jgi:hypothetical protein